MLDQEKRIPSAPKRTPWNKGKLTGAKPPLRPKHVWSIRTKLQVEGRTRDLAMFPCTSGSPRQNRTHVRRSRSPQLQRPPCGWPFLLIFEGQRQRTWQPRPSLPDPPWRRI
jgi:hypothetical protein